MRFSDKDNDIGSIILAVVIMTLVLGAGLYFFNTRSSVQTAWRIPMLEKTVPTVVPPAPQI